MARTTGCEGDDANHLVPHGYQPERFRQGGGDAPRAQSTVRACAGKGFDNGPIIK